MYIIKLSLHVTIIQLVDSAASLFYENGRTLGQVPNDSSLSEQEWFGLKAKVVEFGCQEIQSSD